MHVPQCTDRECSQPDKPPRAREEDKQRIRRKNDPQNAQWHVAEDRRQRRRIEVVLAIEVARVPFVVNLFAGLRVVRIRQRRQLRIDPSFQIELPAKKTGGETGVPRFLPRSEPAEIEFAVAREKGVDGEDDQDAQCERQRSNNPPETLAAFSHARRIPAMWHRHSCLCRITLPRESCASPRPPSLTRARSPRRARSRTMTPSRPRWWRRESRGSAKND